VEIFKFEGNEGALSELVASLDDPDYIIRSAAASALRASVKTIADQKAAIQALRASLAREMTPAETQMRESLKILPAASAASRHRSAALRPRRIGR
jgi:hypothetical protein